MNSQENEKTGSPASSELPCFPKVLVLAQGTVDVTKVAVQGWLPMCMRLAHIEGAKALALQLQAELLKIEKALIDEATGAKPPNLPTLPKDAKLGEGRNRVQPWELN